MMRRKHTRDTNITPGKGKQRNKVAEIGLRPAGAIALPIRKNDMGDKNYV